MGVSPAIFESAGQRTEHYVPGSYSRSANVSSPSGVSAGNHVILAKSTGGQPGKLLSFSSLSDAKDALVSGDLLKAIGYAFNCSNVYTPQKVFAMRVDPATQSELILSSGGTQLLKCKSWDWGVHCNQLKLKVGTGTKSGSKKINIQYKNDAIEIDDIIRESFSLEYVGEGINPTASISTTGITLAATDEDTSEQIDKFTCTWEDATTLEELVVRINDSGVYAATVLDTESDRPSNELDTIAGLNIAESTILYSNNAAFVEELKSVTYIGSVEWISTSTRTVPENTENYVYFTGGSTSTPTTLNWASALEALETEDIQIISTPSTDEDVHALISGHCTSMSSTINRKERTFILGAAIGTNDDDGKTSARGFNSKLGSYIVDSAIANNPLTGETETISGAMLGVMAAAMESAMSVSEPLTFKTINVLGFSKYRTNSNMEEMIKAGVMLFNPNPENVSEYVCIRAVTTFQGKNDLISCERSMVREDLYMNRDLRNRLSVGVGHPNVGSTAEIVQTLKDAADEWATNSYIVDSDKGKVWNIKLRESGDKVYLTYSRYLTAPRNFIFITATNHVYESTMEL